MSLTATCQALLTTRKAYLTLSCMDTTTARILARWLDEPDRYPWEEEYPGDPSIHPENQWRLLRRYFDQDFRRAADPQAEIPAPVTPLEALTLARLIVEQTRAGYWGLVADARKAGESWAEVGAALGMTRQAAWEAYRDYANRPVRPSFERLHAEEAALLGDRPEEIKGAQTLAGRPIEGDCEVCQEPMVSGCVMAMPGGGWAHEACHAGGTR